MNGYWVRWEESSPKISHRVLIKLACVGVGGGYSSGNPMNFILFHIDAI